MIIETATVVKVNEDTVTVEATIKSTCSSCKAQSNCGSGVISRAIAPKTQRLDLRTPMTCRVGDIVKIGVPEAGVVSASLWLYVIPLLVFISAVMGFTYLLPSLGMQSELWTLMASIGVTLLAFVFISGHLKKLDQRRFLPVLIEKVSPAAAKATIFSPS